jgi:hypothetical protein
MEIGDSTLFALAVVHSDGRGQIQGWFRIGQKISGYELTAFDRATENLTVKNAIGEVIELHLPVATVRSGASTAGKKRAPTNREEARASVFQAISEYRKRTQEKFGPAEVIADLDGSLLPESRRANYANARAKVEAQGKVFIPVSVNGKWNNCIVAKEGKPVEAQIDLFLTDQDREEIAISWNLAQAEFVARALLRPQSGDYKKK